MYKKILTFVLFSLFLVQSSMAQIGVGIWPVKLEFDVRPYKTVITELYFFNPTEKKVSVNLKFYCKNCVEDVVIFGYKIGEVEYKLDIKIYPSLINLEPKSYNKTETLIVRVHNPLFIPSNFNFKLFGRNVSMPILSVLFGKKSFNGMVIAETLGEPFNVQITNSLYMNYYGIDVVMFLFCLSFLVLIISLLYREKIKKEIKKILEE